MQKITIIGWTDGFWKWLASFILKNFKDKINLVIIWRNKQKAEKVASDLWCKFSLNIKEEIVDSDITIFAVPIAYTVKTIKTYAPYLKAWSMVLDVTSIKKEPSLALQKYSPDWVFVLPTHPMFWPFISSIAGQIFVLCPLKEEDKKDSRYIFLKKFLLEKKAKVIEEDPEIHDKMMAVVQGLTHINMFVLAETMKKLNFPLKKSFNFVSPIYKIMISSVWRYVGQNPKLYADIQMNNSEILEVHKKFMESISDFNKYVVEKDEDSFIKNIEKSKEFFGEQTEKWQIYTDKIIYLLWKQIEKAWNLVWKEIFLENIYSKEKKSWILEKFEDRKLFLDSWEILDLDKYYII